MKQIFLVWTERIIYSVLLISGSCHAWGYHHPAAIRLPTDKPSTTTTTLPPPTTTSTPTTTATLSTSTVSPVTKVNSNSTTTRYSTTLSPLISENVNTSPAASTQTSVVKEIPTTAASIPKGSNISEPTTAAAKTTELAVYSTKLNHTEEYLSSTTTKLEASSFHEVIGKYSSPTGVPAFPTAALFVKAVQRFAAEKNTSADNTTKSGTRACVRNESQVSYWDFGYCGLNCSSNAECNKQQNEECICDGPCGMTCLSPDSVSVYCDAPRSVENGKALLVGDLGLYDFRNQLQRFTHNQKVIFECDEGFTLIDGPQEKICRHGFWYPTVGEPKCIFSDTPGFRWIQSNRVKRCPKIKIKNNKKGDSLGEEEDPFEAGMGFCPLLNHYEFLQVEVISKGSDPNNTDISEGAVVKVSCAAGYGIANLGNNNTISCEREKWRPRIPNCQPLPCKVPYIAHGTFYLRRKSLFFLEMQPHLNLIQPRCSKGYVLKGPNKSHCWFGEWDLSDAPECIPASCKLPQLERGKYATRYRAGMVVGHGTEVDYHCEGEYQKMAPAGPAKCHLGEFRPNKPACFHPSYIHGVKNFTHDKDKIISSVKRACGLPPKEKGAIFYVEGKPIDYDTDYVFSDATEVMYRCARKLKNRWKMELTKNRWKMVCEDGQWVGGVQNLTCEYNATIAANMTTIIKETIRMINSSCTYRKKETHVVSFSNDQQLTMETSEFPPGSVLINRCVDIGKFKLIGAIRRKCVSGQWLGITPKCEGLSQYYDYAVDKSPTILFRFVNGSIAQTVNGQLLVYTGTTLHMECMYQRKFGRPSWKVSHKHRTYAEGWTDGIEHRGAMLEYRLTIDDATENDSGIYSCSTPSQHSHEIRIIVKKVDCSPLRLEDREGLNHSTYSTKAGTRVIFECASNKVLVGNKEIQCQASGTWNGVVPRCEVVECPDIETLPAMSPLAYTEVTKNGTLVKNETAPPIIRIESRAVGGKVNFTCPQGFSVQGAASAFCGQNGEWSDALPLCKEVECMAPPEPANGKITGTPPYKAGDHAQIDCNNGFIMEGQPTITCQDDSTWSRHATKTRCVAACTYPGMAIAATISEVKFYYPIGEVVEFGCSDGYKLVGEKSLKCMQSTKWSHEIPICKPISDSRF